MSLKRWMGAALVLTACQKEQKKPPTPPDMSALVAAYGSADGRLTPQAAPVLVAGFLDDVKNAAGLLSLTQAVVGLLPAFGGAGADAGVGQGQSALAEREDALSTRGDLWAKLTHRCGPDKADGDIVLENVVEGGLGNLRPGKVTWGTVDACRIPADDVVHVLTGDVQVYVPDFADVGHAGLLVSFLGEWTRGADAPVDLNLDLRIADGVLYLRRHLPDGQRFLVGLRLGDGPGSPLRVVDRDGEWGCTLSEDAASGTCTRGAAEVAW
jgi:hypothetical protein